MVKIFHPRLISLLIGIIAVFVVLAWAWVPESSANSSCKLTHNAAWISVDWSSKPVNEQAVRTLVGSTQNRQIRYLYPYISYVRADGTFSPSHEYAAQFVSAFRQHNHDIQLFAWIGVPLKNERPIGIKGTVDLGNLATRKKIVDFITSAIETAQFDGVHLDVETVQNHDANFLLLLDEVKNSIGASRKLSIATSHWVPDAVNVLPFINDFRWTGDYYAQVAQRVDQMAVMTYDSRALFPAIYRFWMREQVRGIRASLSGSPTELLIGISVSQEETPSHHPRAENLKDGLAGMCAGISDQGKDIAGVAIYADWDFSAQDSQVWNEWQK